MSDTIQTTTEETLLNSTFYELEPQAEPPLIITAIVIPLMVVGVLGNSLVLVVLASIKELRTIPNLLIANQSLLDLTASICMSLIIIPAIPVSKQRPIEGAIICIFLKEFFTFWLAMVGSTFNLVVINLERYYAVVHAIHYRAHASYRRTAFAACIPWFMGLLACAQLFFTSRVGPSGNCVWNFPERYKTLFGVVIFVTQYLCPLVCMLFAYIRIFISLQTNLNNEVPRPSHVVVSGTQDGDNKTRETVAKDVSGVKQSAKTHAAIDINEAQDRTINTAGEGATRVRSKQRAPVRLSYRDQARRNIIMTLLIVSMTYFICWTPNQIIYLVYTLGGPIDFQGSLYRSTITIAFCNICVNPIIYTLKYRHFRKGVKNLFGRGNRRRRRETPSVAIIETASRTQI